MNPSDKQHIRYFHYLYAVQGLESVKDKSLKILDVGCGRGELTRDIFETKKTCKIVACDVDTKALRDFKKNIRGSEIQIVTCDAEELPFADKSFDLVLMFDVLEHLRHPEKALYEIHRVLKSDGRFHLVVPCEADLFTFDGWIGKLFRKNLKEKPIGHIQQFTHQEIKQLLQKQGFVMGRKYFSYYFLYQLLSLAYFAYANFFRSGSYIQLTGYSGKTLISSIFDKLIVFGGWVVYYETKFFQRLPFIRGQTMHVTAYKDVK